MRAKRIEATYLVANQLFAAEAAIDAAIAETAKLNVLMPEARVAASLSAVVGQLAFARAGETLQTLIAAREEIVKTHEALDEVKADIGLREMAMGGAVWKPSARAHLVAVADAA